jgi:four helix bundle protein
MGNYKKLEVWEQSRRLVKEAYSLAATLPQSERFGLVSQIQRAAVSIPCNIAEGSGRGTDASFAQFVRIAIGSAYELETLVTLALDLEMIGEQAAEGVLKSVKDLSIRLQNLESKIRSAVHEEPAVYGQPVSHGSAIVEPLDDN